MSGNPADLLRGALEKIVFFECRVSQLEAELDSARALAAREKEAAAAARAREAELEAALARDRAEAAAARSRADEAEERARLLEGERERFLGGLVERARLGPPAEGDGPDLAGFIAELRGEIERLRRWKDAAERAGLSLEGDEERRVRDLRPAAAGAPEVAVRLDRQGRLGVSPAEAARLTASFASRAERSLYASSLDDLSSKDAERRRRATECLRALGSRAAAPVLAAAVGREPEPRVKAALLRALGALGEPAAAEIALREGRHPSPEVRAAALEAAASLAPERAVEVLSGAVGDPSAAVRRRAVLLLGFAAGEAAEESLESALADRDAGVARAAARVLSGRPSARAQAALAKAVDHREPSVRRAAAEAVSRWAGEPLDAAAGAAERRRAARRVAERLSALDDGALRDAVVEAGAAPGRRAPPAAARPPAPPSAPAAARAARAPAAVVEAGPGSPAEEAVLAEVRTSLRGRTAVELGALVAGGRPAAEAALTSLVARGALARRGARYFPA